MLHRLGDGGHELIQERLVLAEQEALHRRTAQQQPDDVVLLLGTGTAAFVQRKRTGADVIGDPAHGTTLRRRVLILHADDLTGRLTQRLQDVDLEVAQHALQGGGTAFQTHAGVDVLFRQRLQVVRRVADAVELREDQVPDLDRLRRAGWQVIDFTARTADAVGALRRGGGGPEVLPLVLARDPVGRQLDLVVPDPERLVVVEVDGDGQPRRIQSQPFLRGEEFPRPVNGFLLEVVAEREVAEHLEERVVIGRHTDVADVARSQTLLAGGRLGELERPDPQELVLELVHPGRSEQDGLVILGNEHIRRTTDATLGLKELQILFAQFIGFHIESRQPSMPGTRSPDCSRDAGLRPGSPTRFPASEFCRKDNRCIRTGRLWAVVTDDWLPIRS